MGVFFLNNKFTIFYFSEKLPGFALEGTNISGDIFNF